MGRILARRVGHDKPKGQPGPCTGAQVDTPAPSIATPLGVVVTSVTERSPGSKTWTSERTPSDDVKM